MKSRVALSKVMNKNVIHLPKVIREILDLKEGDYITWYIQGNKVIVEKSKDVNTNRIKIMKKEGSQ